MAGFHWVSFDAVALRRGQVVSLSFPACVALNPSTAAQVCLGGAVFQFQATTLKQVLQ